MSTRSLTLRNTAFSSVGIYTEFLLGMLTSIIIARHLGPDGFGAYSLVIWLVAMGVAMTNSGTASAAIKFVAEVRGAGREDLIVPLLAYLRRAQLVFMALVVMAGAALFVFAGDHIAPGFDHHMLVGFLAIAIALRAAYMFNIGVAKGFENFRATAVIALVATPINLGLVIAAGLLDAPVEWLLGVFVVTSVVFWLMSRRQVAALMPAANDARMSPELVARVRHHMRVSAMTVSVGFLAASEVEVLFLTLYSGAHAAGQFKVAYQLALGATMLAPGVFGALLLPMMANALSQGQAIAGRRYVASTRYLAMLSAPLVAFGVVFAVPLIHFMYGGEYDKAAPAFAVCLAAAALTTISQGGSSLLVSADRQRTLLVLVACCAALKIGLDAFLILHFGLDGAVLAYALVALVLAASITLLAIRVSSAAPDWFALLRVAAAAALAALFALPLLWLSQPLLAIGSGGVVLVLVYAVLTLVLRCWSRADIEHLQQMHHRFAAGKPRSAGSLLAWAHARSASGESA